MNSMNRRMRTEIRECNYEWVRNPHIRFFFWRNETSFLSTLWNEEIVNFSFSLLFLEVDAYEGERDSPPSDSTLSISDHLTSCSWDTFQLREVFFTIRGRERDLCWPAKNNRHPEIFKTGLSDFNFLFTAFILACK